jgi:diguanylate cyclase (GGDEF)-like protein
MTIIDTLKRWAGEDWQVRDTALRRNVRVLGLAAWVLLILNVAHMGVFVLLRFDDPIRDAWARQIVLAHGGMAVVAVTIAVLARRVHGAAELTRWHRGLPLVAAVLIIAWAIAVTVIDQAVTASVNAYVNAVIAMAIVYLFPPATALIVLTLAWAGLAGVLGWMVSDPAQLATSRMNAATATALAMLISVLSWRHFVRTELLQRALAESNRQLQAQRAELERLANKDALTGLLNRREFERQAALELARARRLGSPLALFILDLDHFKAVNDTHGHAVGDQVLVEAATRMSRSIRQTDRLARWGGEEFVLLLPDTGCESAPLLAEKLRHAVGDAPMPGMGSSVTVSIGAVVARGDDLPDWPVLLRMADEALYQAKREGRNRAFVRCLNSDRSSLAKNETR